MTRYAFVLIIALILTPSCVSAPRPAAREPSTVRAARSFGLWLRAKYPGVSFRRVHAVFVEPDVAGGCPHLAAPAAQVVAEVREFAVAVGVPISDLRTLPPLQREPASAGRQQYDLALEQPRRIGGDTTEVTMWNMRVGSRDTLVNVYRVVGTDVMRLTGRMCNPQPMD